jgi:hypothetical protein
MLIKNKESIFALDPTTHLPQSFLQVNSSSPLTEEYILLANTLIAEFIRPFCKEKTLLKAFATVIP